MVHCLHCRVLKGYLGVGEGANGKRTVEIMFDSDSISSRDTSNYSIDDVTNLVDSLDEMVVTEQQQSKKNKTLEEKEKKKTEQQNMVCGPLKSYISFCCPNYRYELEAERKRHCIKRCQINGEECIYEIVEDCNLSQFKPIRLEDTCIRYPEYGFKPFIL